MQANFQVTPTVYDKMKYVLKINLTRNLPRVPYPEKFYKRKIQKGCSERANSNDDFGRDKCNHTTND